MTDHSADMNPHSSVYWVSPSKLRPSPANPRRYFDDLSLDDLAKSLVEQDFLHPITVIDDPEQPDHWLIVAGERRWRAALRAGLKLVPTVRRRNLPDEPNALLALQLAENLEHEPLSPYEETMALIDLVGLEVYRRIPDRPEYTPDDEGRRWIAQILKRWVNRPSPAARAETAHTTEISSDELASILDSVFKKREGLLLTSFVSNRLHLLDVPDDVKQALEAGELRYTAAGSIGRVQDPEKRAELLAAARTGTCTKDLIDAALSAKRAEHAPNDPDEARKAERLHEIEPFVKQLNRLAGQLTELNHNKYQAALAALKKLSKALAA